MKALYAHCILFIVLVSLGESRILKVEENIEYETRHLLQQTPLQQSASIGLQAVMQAVGLIPSTPSPMPSKASSSASPPLSAPSPSPSEQPKSPQQTKIPPPPPPQQQQSLLPAPASQPSPAQSQPQNNNNNNNNNNKQVSSFSPAPPEYSQNKDLPTYNQSPIKSLSGPVSSSDLSNAAPSGECKTLGQVLESIPEASKWLALLKNAGLESVLLSDPKAQTTLLVPINSAFNARINLEPLRSEKTMQELISNAPDLLSPLAGYSVIKGLWPSTTLTPNTILPTSNTIDKVNPLTIKVVGSMRLQGIGNSAQILQADIAACGPSVIHIIDQILLPFDLNNSQGPVDAISGTQVPGSNQFVSSSSMSNSG